MTAASRFGVAALLLAAPLAGCGKKASVPSSLASADAQAAAPAYDEAAEQTLDQTVLAADAKPDEHVVTLYFGGGTQGICALWQVRVHGAATPAADGALDARAQGLLQAGGSGDLAGTFKTYGAQTAGIRLLVPSGTHLELAGTQGFCRSGDETDFDVTLIVNVKRSLQRLFSGVDDAAATSYVAARVTAAKAPPTD